MSKRRGNGKPQNIFLIADHLQGAYKQFVRTFQEFQNSAIQNWVDGQMERKDLLYKDPLIELNFQFKKGKSLDQLKKEGVLKPSISKIFDIQPYMHQSEAIEKVCAEKRNIIVSTGTGSGKSECFWIPIINTCLEMKEQRLGGIKAIVIFPMNALANSQYHRIADQLKESGLTIGKYTGDTPNSRKEGEQLLEKNQNREPYVCELLSRKEMQDTPPDILITNYVMLDYILSRFEDRKLFPEKYKGYLKYLVLDEIHTYSGNSGADVAGLIRRLKYKTHTTGKIRCIGTSATIQDNKKTGGTSSIVEFSEKIFGEKFDKNSLIEASYVNLEIPDDQILSLPEKVDITDDELNNFDGTFKTIIPLAEKLLGRHLKQQERTQKGLGELFHRHPTIIFIRNSLKEEAKALNTLAQEYAVEFRGKEENAEDLSEEVRELKAAFLVGTIASVKVQNEDRPLLVPKLHIFFTQGQELFACLTEDGLNEGRPHLNIEGEVICKTCEHHAFPLYFCRNCGHHFYSIFMLDEGLLSPRTFDMEDQEGEMVYITPITEDNNSWQTPGNWFDNRGKIRDTYKNSSPVNAEYCPECNKLGSECECEGKMKVWKIPFPFQLCPACNIYYTKQKKEYSKLFSFNSTGRSSSTDVITMETINHLEKDQKKEIIFTDSRQDTALQAEHLNEFQRRTNFRQIFFHTLKHIEDNNLEVSDKNIGKVMYEFMENHDLVPNYKKKKDEDELYTSDPPPLKEYKEFLSFLSLSDIMQSNYVLDINLEKLGLLKIEYKKLDEAVNLNEIKEISPLGDFTSDERYDYIRGILDIFRWSGAIASKAFIDTVNKYNEWKELISEDILFDINKSRYNRVGFAYEKPKNKKVWDRHDRVIFKTISHYNTILIIWTKKYFGLDDFDQANSILEKTIEKLKDLGFLDVFWTRKPNTYKLYQIKEGKVLFRLNKDKKFLKCPKCHRTYYFKQYHKCTRYNCPELEYGDVDSEHFYFNLYQQLPNLESKIYAREHSAQLEGEKRERFEQDFQKTDIGSTNVLVCTPTMELGIDIGELSAIMMRNVPPDPSRYAQRSGRAGRKNQPSVVSVFCGSGMAKGPHDQYFYKEPEKIVSGKINPPNFLLDNKKLIEKHLHSAIIEALKIKIPQKVSEILRLEDYENDFPMFKDFKDGLIQAINTNKDLLKKTINEIFQTEIAEFSWFTQEFINKSITNFHADLDLVLNNFRDTFSEIRKEIIFIQNKELMQRPTQSEQNERMALIRKLNDMREGKRPYDTFGFLRNYGFLPNYGFPSDNKLLTMFDHDERKYRENWRSSVIAIREFAPHNRVYFLGSKYRINRAMVKSERGQIETDKIYICENCNEIMVSDANHKSTSLVRCPSCEEEVNLDNFKSSINFPHMRSMSGPRITCDEESRHVKGYEITMNYKRKPSAIKQYQLTHDGKAFGMISYEHNGKIYMVNKGTKVKSKTSNEIRLQPFNYCTACGHWLSEGKREEHFENCPKNGKASNLQKDLWLFIGGNHDVMVFDIPLLGKPDITSYYTTLKETIIQSLMLTYNLDDSELNGFINPNPGSEEQSVVIFETEDGGTGVLKSLLDTTTTQFDTFVDNMFRILHVMAEEPYEETMDACVTACYNCLLRFRNQFEHKFLNRNLVIPLMKELKKCELSVASEEAESLGLDALKEKCDSELEKAVLDTIIDIKLPLPDDAQITYFENDVPITTADFFYAAGNNHVYVFVDGPPHTPDHKQEEDAEKRLKLEAKGYSVVELDFKDGNYTSNDDLIQKEIETKLKPYII